MEALLCPLLLCFSVFCLSVAALFFLIQFSSHFRSVVCSFFVFLRTTCILYKISQFCSDCCFICCCSCILGHIFSFSLPFYFLIWNHPRRSFISLHTAPAVIFYKGATLQRSRSFVFLSEYGFNRCVNFMWISSDIWRLC